MNRLPIKHPELRPRIYDPLAPNPGSQFDDPGAIAMRGPDARRGDDMTAIAQDDVSVSTVDDGQDDDEIENGARLEQAPPADATTTTTSDDYFSLHSRPEDQTKKHRWMCVATGLVVLAMSCGIVATLVLKLLLGGERAMRPQSPILSPPSSFPMPTTDDGQVKEGDLDWTLVSEIVGSVDSFGFDVDFNSDATLVAVSAPRAHSGRGQVEVYRRNNLTPDNGLENWGRVGDPIVGDSEGDLASLGMDLSIDGSYLAVGFPGNGNGFVRVYRVGNGRWIQHGQTLAGPSLMSRFGISVSIALDCTYLLVGAPLGGDREHGMVQAYKWIPEDETWTEYGEARYGDSPGDHFGSSLGISINGKDVVVGAPGDDTRWEEGGRIHFLKLQSDSSKVDCRLNGCWEDVLTTHTSFTGEAAGDRFGQKIEFHPYGDGVISSSISYHSDEPVKTFAQETEGFHHGKGIGKVRAFSYDPGRGDAGEIGFGICGSREGEGLGYDVTFNSGAGLLIAATSLNGGNQTGVTRAYEFEIDRFVQKGNDIGTLTLGSGAWLANGSGNDGGPSISMAKPRLAVGYQSVLLDEEQEVPGVVRVFSIGI